MAAGLTICGSSSLLETNQQWQKLARGNDLKFAAYGDYISPLLTAPDDAIIMVLFLEDMVPDIGEDLAAITDRFFAFFDALAIRAKQSSQPLVICWGRMQADHPLRAAKTNTNQAIIFNWFLKQFQKLRQECKSFYLIDQTHIFAAHGWQKMLSDRNWYFARCRLSIEGLTVLIDTLTAILNRCVNAPAKVLVLDCDNTLWGGVVGEDGVEGLVLGQDGLGSAFVDFQKQVVNLVSDGVIVVLASKNNEQDVWQVFDQHPFMQLKRSHIISHKINWNEKAPNIKAIADQLDLALDSFVFWDDNAVERDKVKHLLPQVFTVDVPSNIYEWPRLLAGLDCFAKFETTIDDRQKPAQYQARAQFSADIKTADNITAYLKSIDLKPRLLPLDDGIIGRAVQLCQKTNQYNLRTIRHNAAALMQLRAAGDDFVFLVQLKDIYGDHGIVALVCLRPLDDKLVFLDSFMMSCRVLGRHLEAWILSQITAIIARHGAKYLIAEYRPSDRNQVARQFIDDYGFCPIKDKPALASKIKDGILGEDIDPKGDIYYIDPSCTAIPHLDIYMKEVNDESS